MIWENPVLPIFQQFHTIEDISNDFIYVYLLILVQFCMIAITPKLHFTYCDGFQETPRTLEIFFLKFQRTKEIKLPD